MRFPGFEGDWEELNLNEVMLMSSGGTPSMQRPEYWGGDIPFISASTMHDTLISNSHQHITKEGLRSGSKLLKKGNLLLLVRGSMLWKQIPICYNKVDVAFNQDVKGIVANDKTTSLFLLYWFKSKEAILKDMVTSTGIGAGKFDSDSLLSLSLLLPNKSEQSKISKILCLIDERIQTQNKIIEQLETLIKGIRDKLLSQQIRFKNVKRDEFSSWTKNELGDIGDTYNGLTGKTKEDFGKGKRYIQYKQIFDSSRVQVNGCGLVQVMDNENQNIVEYGDILFTISSETPEEIGMASVLLEKCENVFLNSFCFGFRPNNVNELVPEYAQYFFRSKIFRNELITLAQGSTRYNLSKVEFLKISILLPSREEQAQISKMLTLINEKIEIEKRILANYQMQKKYFLESFFI